MRSSYTRLYLRFQHGKRSRETRRVSHTLAPPAPRFKAVCQAHPRGRLERPAAARRPAATAAWRSPGRPIRKLRHQCRNSGASTSTADFKDANTPTWRNVVEGQRNMIDVIERTIDLRQRGQDHRHDEFYDETANVSSSCWYFSTQRHVKVDGEVVLGRPCSTSACTSSTTPGAWFDKGSGLYFDLPQLRAPRRRRRRSNVFLTTLALALGPRPRRTACADGARRDAAPRCFRDGGDPPRASRALRRAQRRPPGRHPLHDQALPRPAPVRHALPRRR